MYRARHDYPEAYTVELLFYHIPTLHGVVRNYAFEQVRWGALTRLPKFDFLDGRLAQVAEELWEGESFNVTRLTTIKSLCEDAKAAAQFDFHLATLTHKAMEQKACPKHIHAENRLLWWKILPSC